MNKLHLKKEQFKIKNSVDAQKHKKHWRSTPSIYF